MFRYLEVAVSGKTGAVGQPDADRVITPSSVPAGSAVHAFCRPQQGRRLRPAHDAALDSWAETETIQTLILGRDIAGIGAFT